ncbi:MAG: ABC transporter permease [Tannerellaceae bacterium]|nr:ABC transporter permease [Tannerellaceae bacterium]
MLKQNKFISIISILGTALAIMMIMTLIVADEVKILNMAPEINRDRTLYIDYQVKRDTVEGWWHSGYLTHDIAKDYLSKLKTPAYTSFMNVYGFDDEEVINVEGESDYRRYCTRKVDAAFWKIFSFDFLEGNAFSEEEFKSGIHNAVLSESMAKTLFKGEKVLGKTVQIAFRNYKVTGIVKDVSPVFKYAGGDMWIPYTSLKDGLHVGFVVLMAKDKEDFPRIIAEVREMERKFGIDHHHQILYLKGPENQKINIMEIRANNEQESIEAIKIKKRRAIFIFLILLIIPALNLSGFSLSRIKKRVAEIGVRKAFGAKKYVILIQVLYENMITSFIGGIIGLILSYVTVMWLRSWLLKIPEGSDIPLSAMLSPTVFAAVFFVCLLLNLLSAGFSAFRASRMTIVNSLTQNDR